MKNDFAQQLESCLIINNKNMSQILNKKTFTRAPLKPKTKNLQVKQQDLKKNKSKPNFLQKQKILIRQERAYKKHTIKKYEKMEESLKELLQEKKEEDKRKKIKKSMTRSRATLGILRDTKVSLENSLMEVQMRKVGRESRMRSGLKLAKTEGFTFVKDRKVQRSRSITKTGFSFCYSRGAGRMDDEENNSSRILKNEREKNSEKENVFSTESKRKEENQKIEEKNDIGNFTIKSEKDENEEKILKNEIIDRELAILDPNLYTFAHEVSNQNCSKAEILKEIEQMKVIEGDLDQNSHWETLTCNQSIILLKKNGSRVEAEVGLEELFECLVLK